MRYNQKYHYQKQYEFASVNQHGNRYRKVPNDKQLCVVRIEAEFTNADGLTSLICMGNALNVPVRYDYAVKPQVAFIELISVEALQECT